jgi:archaellum component FlaC
MDKALRVLAIIILILAIVAMVFAQLSFMKRQVLLGRNSMFEEQVIKVAKTIEAADAADVPAPDVQKDVAEVSDRELANPERTSVFENYPAKLETQNLTTLDYSTIDKRRQLRSYYVLDQATGKYQLSELDGKPKKDGPGSMAALLEEMLTRAMAQKAVLEKTRGELTKARELVTSLVTEMNKMKVDWRVTKRELKESREECEKLKEEKAALEAQVAKLTAEKKELTAELADAKAEIEKKDSEIAGLRDQIVQLEKINKELKERIRPGSQTGAAGIDGIAVAQLTAGVKGKVVDANDDYKFAIIEFTDEALVEMMGPERANPLPQLEMNVRRKGRQSASGEFVTRVKIRQVVKGKNLVVADILTDWQQVAVEKDDVVFF